MPLLERLVSINCQAASCVMANAWDGSELCIGCPQEQKDRKRDKEKEELALWWGKYQEAAARAEQVKRECAAEEAELRATLEMLKGQLELKNLIVKAFIPPHEVEKV